MFNCILAGYIYFRNLTEASDAKILQMKTEFEKITQQGAYAF
jgi:hypothetical protein